jgi:hypothetical protein
MVTKCANPQCSTPFRYLRDGKVFRIDVDEPENTVADPRGLEKPWHRVEHFWLCGKCALTMTLVSEKGRGVTAVPLSQLYRRAS